MYLDCSALPVGHNPATFTNYTVTSLHHHGSGTFNEDVLLRSGNLFGVFDGATSLGNHHNFCGITGGLHAAQLAAQSFRDSPDNLFDVATQANQSIRLAQLKAGVPVHERHLLWSTSMAVIRLSGSFFEYCYTGDTLILLLYDDGSQYLLTPELNIDVDTLQMWQDLPSATEPIHDLLADQIAAVRLRMNIDYGVLNGEQEALSFITHGTHNLTGVSDILLFTDGLILPKTNPREPSDWNHFAGLFRSGGLSHLFNTTRTLQISDPSCKKYPRFKQHDDIAAVAVTFSS